MVVPLRKDCADWNKFRKNSPDTRTRMPYLFGYPIAKGKSEYYAIVFAKLRFIAGCLEPFSSA
jgi:hypothetical protein